MDQLKKLVLGLSVRQRISIILVALLVGGGVFGIVRWKRESDFKPLFSSMAPEDASAVTQKLRESGVEYRLSETGTTVSVSSSKLAESRLSLAAAGLPKSGRIGFELFDKSNFGATDFVEHINYKRALEGELERTVMSLAEVEQARIHLTMPKESVFLDKEQPAKASVMLKLRPGANLSRQSVLSVANLVASAVEGLSPDAVSIVDMNGALLNRPKRNSAAENTEDTSEGLEARQQIERDLVRKVHSTLEPVLGPDRFRVGASVDYDLTSGDQQEETFDPTRSVMVSSQKTEDATERAAASGGIPGTASNLPGGAPPVRVAGSGGTSRRTENVSYQSSRVVKHTRIPQGIVRRMSLAVLVDQSVRWEGQGSARHRVFDPPSPERLKAIRELVAASAGLNSERGDQLTVESLPFETSLTAEQPESTTPAPVPSSRSRQWQDVVYNRYFGPIVAGVALMIALAGVLLRGKRRRTNTPRVEVRGQIEGATRTASDQQPLQIADTVEDSVNVHMPLAPAPSKTEIAGRVRALAQRDASATANIIRAWLREEAAQ